MNNLEEIFVRLGFSDKESRVYLAVLHIGETRVSEIATAARLNRITTYDTCKRLVKKGYGSFVEREGIKSFSVLSPDRLFQYVVMNVEEFRKQLKHLLFLGKHTGVKPKVSFYEGLSGLRHVYEDFTSTKNCQVVSVSSVKDLYEATGRDFLHRTYRNRKKNNITVRSLSPDTPESVEEHNFDERASRKMKFFPHQKYRIPNEIIVYANKVALMSFSNKIAVIVEDKEIAESMRTLLQIAWDRF